MRSMVFNFKTAQISYGHPACCSDYSLLITLYEGKHPADGFNLRL